MSREKMLQAQALIREKRYDEARAILKTVNRPIAREWLAKLDEIAPEPEPEIVQPNRRSRLPLYGIVGVLIVALVVAGVLIIPGILSNKSAGNADSAEDPLAQYFPADTQFYMNIRIDDAQIDSLDALYSRIIGKLPPDMLWPGIPASLKAALDTDAQATFGADFQTGMRPWLGNYAAAGLRMSIDNNSMFGDDFAFFTVVEITDRDKAIAYLDESRDPGMSYVYSRREENGYMVYESEFTLWVVGDNAMFESMGKTVPPLDGLPNPSLKDSAVFQNTLAKLPGDDYAGVVYFNLSSLINSVDRSVLEISPSTMPESAVDSLLSIESQMALGFAIQDERSLVVDAVSNFDTAKPLEDLGFSLQGTGPVNPNFLAYVPANASFVMQGTDLKTVYELLLSWAKAGTVLGDPSSGDFDQSMAQLDLTLQQFAGLSLEDDILSWLTGDYAVFIRYDAPPPGTPPIFASSIYPDRAFDFNLEAGLVIEAVDADKARNVVEKLASALQLFGMSEDTTVTREQIAGENVVVLATRQDPFASPIEIVIGANDRVLVIATRQSATDILSGADGLNKSSVFKAAQNNMLKDATTVWYFDANAVNLVADVQVTANVGIDAIYANVVAALEGNPTPTPDLAQQQASVERAQREARFIASLVESGMFTTSAESDGNWTARFVLTLSDSTLTASDFGVDSLNGLGAEPGLGSYEFGTDTSGGLVATYRPSDFELTATYFADANSTMMAYATETAVAIGDVIATPTAQASP